MSRLLNLTCRSLEDLDESSYETVESFMLLADAENRTKYFLNEQNHSQNALLYFVAFLCLSGLVFWLGFLFLFGGGWSLY